MTVAEISVLLGIVAVACGFLGWIGRGIWFASGRSSTLDSHDRAIAAINTRCEQQKQKILSEVKQAVCDAMKYAIKDLELEYSKRQSATEKEIALHGARLDAVEADIENLFGRVRDLEKIPEKK